MEPLLLLCVCVSRCSQKALPTTLNVRDRDPSDKYTRWATLEDQMTTRLFTKICVPTTVDLPAAPCLGRLEQRGVEGGSKPSSHTHIPTYSAGSWISFPCLSSDRKRKGISYDRTPVDRILGKHPMRDIWDETKKTLLKNGRRSAPAPANISFCLV